MRPSLGSIFAGIGGFDLGFEQAGFSTLFQIENDSQCQRVLRLQTGSQSGRIFRVQSSILQFRESIINTGSAPSQICQMFPDFLLGASFLASTNRTSFFHVVKGEVFRGIPDQVADESRVF